MWVRIVASDARERGATRRDNTPLDCSVLQLARASLSDDRGCSAGDAAATLSLRAVRTIAFLWASMPG